MNPDNHYVNNDFDYEVPCYVYGYYNGGDIADAMTPETKQLEEKLELSTTFLERLRNKRLSKQGFPSVEKFVNKTCLVCIGDNQMIYELVIREISARARALYIDRVEDTPPLISSPLDLGDNSRDKEENRRRIRTITPKMIGWWRIDQVTFIDSLIDEDTLVDEKLDSIPESKLPRSII